MGDDAIGLAQACALLPLGGEKDGEKKDARRGPALRDAGQRRGGLAGRQMGKDAKGDQVIDMRGQVWEGEIGIFHQMIGGQAFGIGQFHFAAALHQGAACIGAPIMAWVKIRNSLAAKTQRSGTDIEEVVMGLQPARGEQRHLQPPRLIPTPAHDIAVAAIAERAVVEAGDEVGGWEAGHRMQRPRRSGAAAKIIRRGFRQSPCRRRPDL
jgi:hypothetical protein